MAEEEKVEMTEQKQAFETDADPQKQETPPEMDPVKLLSELEQTRKALKDANAEAAARRKRLEELETAENKRKEAELSEIEKLQKRADEAEARAKALERKSLQREVAEKVGLPAALASRLRGDTEAEMEEDAKTLLESLPKSEEVKSKPKIEPTNPGTGASTQETYEQKRARLLGQKTDPWATGPGGGVVWIDKE